MVQQIRPSAIFSAGSGLGILVKNRELVYRMSSIDRDELRHAAGMPCDNCQTDGQREALRRAGYDEDDCPECRGSRVTTLCVDGDTIIGLLEDLEMAEDREVFGRLEWVQSLDNDDLQHLLETVTQEIADRQGTFEELPDYS